MNFVRQCKDQIQLDHRRGDNKTAYPLKNWHGNWHVHVNSWRPCCQYEHSHCIMEITIPASPSASQNYFDRKIFCVGPLFESDRDDLSSRPLVKLNYRPGHGSYWAYHTSKESWAFVAFSLFSIDWYFFIVIAMLRSMEAIKHVKMQVRIVIFIPCQVYRYRWCGEEW